MVPERSVGGPEWASAEWDGAAVAAEGPMSRPHLQFVFVMGAAVVVNLGGGAAVAETPKEIIAAQIRMQGFACDKPVSAERDRAASRPNETVWLLKCEDHSYRVRLVPDMAADVLLLD
jgi:hypothetical protein